MKKLKQLKLLTLTFILILSSCSMEKRVYSSGYNIEWISLKHQSAGPSLANHKETHQAERNDIPKVKYRAREMSTVNENVTASIDSSFTQISAGFIQNKFPGKPVSEKLMFPEDCDLIILTNGDEINAKVVEIVQNEIKYKKCENQRGPIYSIKKSDVFMIKYPNGTKDIIRPNNHRSNISPVDNNAPKTEGLGLAGFFASIIGFIIAGIPLGLIALIFGLVSIVKITNHPEKFKGKGFAYVSIFLGFIDIVGALIALSMLHS